MILRTVASLILVGCAPCICSGQKTNETEKITWGAPVAELRLSIGLTNDTIIRGSNLLLHARIRNDSSNVVAFGSVFEPVYNFSVKLLDTNGTEHDPIIKMPGRMGNANGAFHDTGPHSTYETMIPINNLNPALLPGQYRFLAKRLVFLRRNGNLEMNRKLELFSNLLEVQVK